MVKWILHFSFFTLHSSFALCAPPLIPLASPSDIETARRRVVMEFCIAIAGRTQQRGIKTCLSDVSLRHHIAQSIHCVNLVLHCRDTYEAEPRSALTFHGDNVHTLCNKGNKYYRKKKIFDIKKAETKNTLASAIIM
jgi:hypothetical protein